MAISAATPVITRVPTMALAKPPAVDVTSCGVDCVKNATFQGAGAAPHDLVDDEGHHGDAEPRADPGEDLDR